MDDRSLIAGLLGELEALGVRELFLDDLTAEEATEMLAAARAAQEREAAAPAARETEPARRPPVDSTGSRPPATPRDPASELAARRPGPPTGAGEAERLKALESEASGCVKCRLAEGRTHVVFGRGSPAAELVVVGEAPGRQEDRTGLPFVGPAGKLLDLLLLSVGFERDRVYICNVLKCRPPNNRDPQPDEVATCSPYLHGQLDAIQPQVLLAVGKFAAQMLTGRESAIGRLRGAVHEYRGIPVVATYHPAYLLRSPQATRKTWQDLQLMRQVMDEHT